MAPSSTPGPDDSDYTANEHTSKQPASLHIDGSEACGPAKGTAQGNLHTASDPHSLRARLQLVSPTGHLGTQRTDRGGDSGGPVHPLLLSRWCGGHRSHLRNRLSAIAPEHVTLMQPSSLLPQTNSRGGVCIPLSSQWISSTWRRGQKKDAEEHEGSSHTWWGWSERGFRRQWLLRVARVQNQSGRLEAWLVQTGSIKRTGTQRSS